MYWTVVILILLTILLCDFIYKKRVRTHFRKHGIPGPRLTLPLIGDVLMTMGTDPTNVFKVLGYFREKYGKVFHVWIFHFSFVLVQNIEYLEPILSSPRLIKKNFIYDMLRRWLNDGLLLSSGSKWHARRKIITRSYHFAILEQFVEVFDRQSETFVERLRGKADGKTVIEMFSEVCPTALDIITETAMGVKIDAQKHPNLPYVKALAHATKTIARRAVQPAFYLNFLYNITHILDNVRVKKSIRIMHEFTNSIIRERRKALNDSLIEENQKDTERDLEVGTRKSVAFLDLLLQSTIDGKPLSNEDIREEVDTFMFEGHDTTTSGLAHTLYRLARHPNAQQKAYEEVQQVLNKSKSEPITMKDLQNLKYLECVIKEALRLHPSVPLISRVSEEEFKIGNFTLPRNTHIVLPLYAVGRDPQYFSNPDDFLPERFLLENTIKIHPFSFVPFSAGPRNCVGQKFAMLEMKMIVGKVLRDYEILPLGPDIMPIMSLILRSTTGINLGLKPRA
uniref:Cytochrome P450 n=1 Tax=Glossina pallidipes TaxID=7398 RepID=A0A1A9ZLJ0_GLOPL